MVTFYDPLTGQFFSRDPLVSTTRSAYGYVGGRPTNRTDPSGMAMVGACGDVSGDMGIYFSGQVCIVTDGYVVAAIAGGEIAGGGLSASATADFFYSNADRVDQLSGVSKCVGVGAGEGPVGGGEICWGAEDDVNFKSTGVWSFYGGGGIGAGLPVDGHIGVSRTGVRVLSQFRDYPGETENWDSWWNPLDAGCDPNNGGDSWDSWWNPWG